MKSFRYPPILPIVYYEGTERWTAGIHLRDRVMKVEGMEEFIPDFAYKLIRIHDYSNAELLGKADEMSLIMMLNKIQTAEDLHGMLDISGEKINEIVRHSEENVLTVIRDVVYLLCRKMNLPTDETGEVLSQLKEGRNMGYLFENMEHMDIQEERRKTKEAQAERDNAQKELNEAYKNCIRLCKKHSLKKEDAITELLEDGTLTREKAVEIVDKYWDSL